MTPRALFNIILKIIGIFVIKDLIATIPQLLYITRFFTGSDSVGDGILLLAIELLTLLVYGLMIYYLIFRTDLVIDKLKLDKWFDQEIIPINIHRSTILSIAIIVIGGLLVVDEIPNFCRLLFSYFTEKSMTQGLTHPTISYLVVSGAKIFVGILLMSYQRQIVNLIERQRKK